MSTSFASWIRRGLVGASSTLLAPEGSALRLGARLRARVNQLPTRAVNLAVLAPGDVIGIDPAQILRSDPHPGAEGVEATRFASVELVRPDLPWLFTPQSAAPRLPPWIVLAVVPVTDCELAPRRDLPPLLRVDAAQLPPLEQSWAWAHVQVPATSATGADVPSGARARLVCPRQLRPFTRYLAAILPAFAAGRRAGLGLDPDATTGPAWTSSAGQIELPVYHHWWFATGEGGDFESLARGLTALNDPPDGLGVGRLDVSAPGPPSLASPGRTTDLIGPLAASDATVGNWSAAERDAIAAQLAPSPAARILAPPVYGAWAAGESGTPQTGRRRWIGQLNLHPAYRAAAGSGAAVVRRRQHDFVQEAWEQAGEIEAVNRLLDRGRLGRRVSVAIERRHVAQRDLVDLIHLAGPVLARLPHRVAPRTLAGVLIETRLPTATYGAAFRRMLRPTGPLARRGVTDAIRHRVVTELGTGALDPDRSRTGRPGGLVTIGGLLDVMEGARTSRRSGVPVTITPRVPETTPDAAGVRVDVRLPAAGGREGTTIRVVDRSGLVGASTTVRLSETPRLPRRASLEALDLERLSVDDVKGMSGSVWLDAGVGRIDLTADVQRELLDFLGDIDDPQPGAADLAGIAAEIRFGLSPERALTTAVLRSVERPAATGDQLAPVLVAPRIDEPLWRDLAELASDLFLPGADSLPAEHATLVATSPSFVAAFMAGANEEMMRELRWRGYPTDGRGTVFHRFWDRRTSAGAAADDLVAAVDQWRNNVGDDLAGSTGELVLVIRSELFRRYPGTLVTAVPAIFATPRRPNHAKAIVPAFHGTLPRGVAFFGFPISIEEAVGVADDPSAPGWFVVFHQPPTDLGFGIDNPQPEAAGAPPSWLDPTTFGATAAAVAAATVQLPVRLAVHASDLAMLPGLP